MSCGREWEPKELALLKRLCNVSGLKTEQIIEIMAIFGYKESRHRLERAINKYNIYRRDSPCRKWSERDDETLRHLYNKDINIKDLSKTLHRSVYAIQKRAQRLGLSNKERKAMNVEKIRKHRSEEI